MNLAAAGQQEFVSWTWIREHPGTIRRALIDHLTQTAIAIGVGFVIALLLATVAVRWRWTARPITWTAAAIYTVPSLALFALLIPITGLTLLTAEIALVGYTLLNLVPTIIAGFNEIPRATLDAADGLGMSRFRRVVSVEIPLALGQIVGGLRIATVSTVGLVTISSFVALGGGLGALITDGRARDFSTPIVVGVVGSALLAVILDGLFVVIQRLLTPWTRHRNAATDHG